MKNGDKQEYLNRIKELEDEQKGYKDRIKELEYIKRSFDYALEQQLKEYIPKSLVKEKIKELQELLGESYD